MVKQIHKKNQPKAVSTNQLFIECGEFCINHIYIFILILAVIFLGIGKYFEFSTPGPFDSGAYTYSAKHILDGARIGYEEKPTAQVGTLICNMLGVKLFGFNDSGPKVIQMLLQISAMIAIFFALKELIKNKTVAAISVLLACFYLSSPFIAKFGNVKEQYMISFMIIGISFFIISWVKQKNWAIILSGLFVGWGPMFKETSISAIIAIIGFLIIAATVRFITFKNAYKKIALVLAGLTIGIAPVYIWIYSSGSIIAPPYASIIKIATGINVVPKRIESEPVSVQKTPEEANSTENRESSGGYIGGSWDSYSIKTLAPKIFRYLIALKLMVIIPLTAILLAITRWCMAKKSKIKLHNSDKVVILMIIWWLLDIIFIWISPRSYEQYYLPMCASASILACYPLGLFAKKLNEAISKPKWYAASCLIAAIMIASSWNIVYGNSHSPHSGTKYDKPKSGYAQKFKEIKAAKTNPPTWLVVSNYIKDNTNKDDLIFVWGWYPGIYVKSSRMSSSPQAFDSTMHTTSPDSLRKRTLQIVADMQKNGPPAFIIDTKKRHFPWNKPPLELWISTNNGLIPNNADVIKNIESQYYNIIAEKIDTEEANRFNAMKPLRDYIIQNYVPAEANDYIISSQGILHRQFKEMRVFKLKK